MPELWDQLGSSVVCHKSVMCMHM